MKLSKTKTGYSANKNGFEIQIVKKTARKWNAYIFWEEDEKLKSHNILGSKTRKETIEKIEAFIYFQTLNAKNIDYQEVEAMFVSPEYEYIQSPFMIKRVQKGRDRYYCTFNEEDTTFYLSVTSFSSKALSNPHLATWRGNLGNEAADSKAKTAADYGTFLHIQIGLFLKGGLFNFDTLDEIVILYLLDEGLDISLAGEWIDKAHNDMLSFIRFCIDKEVEPIGIEFPVVSPTWKLGGVLDLVCKCKYNKKKVVAIIDYKSGRKGFYESHELQLKTYKELWNENFGDILEVTHVFNWSPKAWRCFPTYAFKNQTDGALAHDLLMRRALVEGWAEDPKPLKRGKGVFEFGKGDINDNISIIELSDFIKGKKPK